MTPFRSLSRLTSRLQTCVLAVGALTSAAGCDRGGTPAPVPPAAPPAQAPVKEEAAKQEASGKITAKVEDKSTPSAEPKDQLKVSKTEMSGTKPITAAKPNAEDQIAKEKALSEANQRLAMLEKNMADLQKLIELKNQNLAELQKQAAGKSMPVEAKKPAEEAKSQTPPPAPPIVPAKAWINQPPASIQTSSASHTSEAA